MKRSFCLLILLAAWIGLGPALAFAYRHHRGYSGGNMRGRAIASIRMQVAAFDAIANRADEVAAENKVVVDAANSRISGDREAIDASHGDQRQANKDMAAAEAEMLDSAGGDSGLVKDKKRYEQARAALQSAESRVLHSPEYLAEIGKTEGDPEHADVVPKIRAKFLDEDEGYQHALTMWEIAHKAYSGERLDALTHDEHWLAASEEKRKALLAEAKALNDAKSGGLQKLPAAVNMHEAQRIAQQVRTYAAMGRSMLGSMGASMPAARRATPTPRPTFNSTGN